MHSGNNAADETRLRVCILQTDLRNGMSLGGLERLSRSMRGKPRLRTYLALEVDGKLWKVKDIMTNLYLPSHLPAFPFSPPFTYFPIERETFHSSSVAMSSFANDLIQLPSLTIFLCISIISSLILVLARFHGRAPFAPYPPPHDPPVNTQPTGYPAVERLTDFDWKKKEPLKLRPFKPKYNLTMSMYTRGKDTYPC